MRRPEGLVGEPSGVRVVLGYTEVRLVVGEPVENVGGVADGGVYDLRVERGVLVGDVGAEGDSAVPAVLCVRLREGVHGAAGEEAWPSEGLVRPDPQCRENGSR